MKISKVIGLLILLAIATGAKNTAIINDFSALAWYSAASNDSGQTGVAFVSKDDTVGDSVFPICYQSYKGSNLTANDTLVRNWQRNTSFGASRFSLALDRNGFGHFVYCGGDSVYYLSNRTDGKWKVRYRCGYIGLCCGRINAIALYGDQLDIIYVFDHVVGGGYVFSNIRHLSALITADSINVPFINTLVNDSANDINNEFIYDVKMSDSCGRLVILQANSQYGGYASDKLIVSKTYPVISDYYCLILRQSWREIVTPISIVQDVKSRITVAINGAKYQVSVSNSGLSLATGIRFPASSASASAIFNLRQRNCQILDPLGRVYFNGSTKAPNAAGMYLLKTPNASTTIKRLQIRR